MRFCQEKEKTKGEKRMRRTEEEEVLVKGGDSSVLIEKDYFKLCFFILQQTHLSSGIFCVLCCGAV